MVYCKFCGEKLNEEGQCPNNHEFKKMCLNCAFCAEVEEAESGKSYFICSNEENKETAKEKMLKLLEENKGGYSVTNLEIAPLPIKRPELKCSKWELNDVVKDEVLGLFK